MSKNKGKITTEKIIINIILIIGILVGVFAFQPEFDKNFVEAKKISYQELQIDKDKLNVLYLNVGQADSIFITQGDTTMLIDAGNDADGDYVVNFLKDQGIKKLDYVIGTHADEDHIGGMDEIINAFEIGHFYMPYVTTTKVTYKNIQKAINQKGYKIENINIGDTFNLSEVNCKVMSVDNKEKETTNDSSIVIQMNYKDNKFLFTGDMSETIEKTIKWEDIDVLKVGHHGSSSSSCSSFLKQIKPEYAVISCGIDNKYGHPTDAALDRLEKIGSAVFRTDKQGTIWIISDGINIEVNQIDISLDGNSVKTSYLQSKSYEYKICA